MAIWHNKSIDDIICMRWYLSTVRAFSFFVFFRSNSLSVVMSANLLQVKRMSPNAVLPMKRCPTSAAIDLFSAYDVVVPANSQAIIKTDVAIAIPEHTYARIASLTSIAVEHFVDVGAGVVDYDYRGNVGVVLFNHSTKDFQVTTGKHIAQMLVQKIAMPVVKETEELTATERGTGGFGSTGVVAAAADKENAPARNAADDATQDITQFAKRQKLDNESGCVLNSRKLADNAVLPVRGSAFAAGFDLSSAVDLVVAAKSCAIVDTGIWIEIPPGLSARVAPRSGLAAKQFIDIGAGVVNTDDINSSVRVVLFNHGNQDFVVKVGDRVAQLVLEQVVPVEIIEVETLPGTVRGAGGFGSTGLTAITNTLASNEALHTDSELLQVKRITEHAIVPSRGSEYAAGFDLSSAYDCEVPPHSQFIVKTDIAIAIPPNTYARVAPRSSLAAKHFVDVGAGVVDYDYRGNVGVVLFNHADVPFKVSRGDRVAQLVLERIAMSELHLLHDDANLAQFGNSESSAGIVSSESAPIKG